MEVASLAHSSSIPIALWIKVVRAHNMKQRAKEEQQIVKTEMANVGKMNMRLFLNVLGNFQMRIGLNMSVVVSIFY